jgi:ABC-2 type transport system permease protein
MLADAIAAEAYRLRRNGGVMFWGFAAVPLGILAFNLMLNTWIALHMRLPVRLDLGQQLIGGVALTGSAFFQVFYAAAAASLFAADYRWETWRLITPRNSRANLILARFAVFGAAAAISLVLLGMAALLQCLYGAMIGSAALILPQGPFLLPLLGTFIVGWCELMVLAGIVAVIAILFRAALGALMTAMAFSFSQWVAMAIIHPWAVPLSWYAALPRLSAYVLRAFVTGQELAPGIAASSLQASVATLSLLGWMLLLGGCAVGLFQRQELARE